MLASDAEPKHYAGLALLKLADNFENHLKIAEEGGIQALLRLGRTRSTDEQMQYKAALTVGQLASNAVRMLPKGGGVQGGANGGPDPIIGHGAKMMNRLRSQVNAQKAKESTIGVLHKSLAESERDEAMQRQADEERAALQASDRMHQSNVTQTALNIGLRK